MATGSKTWPQGVANTLDAIKLAISEMSDEVYMAESKTSMLTPNPALVRGFQQAKTGQLSSLTMDGLGNYDKQKGYPSGSVSLGWEDYTLANDRARSFDLDSVDIMQEAGQLEAGRVITEFVRQKVVPEIDALAMAAIAQRIIGNQGTVTSGVGHNIEYGYTPVVATFVGKIVDALNKLRDETGIEDGYTIFVNGAYRSIIEGSTEVQKVKSVSQLAGVDTRTPTISGQSIVWMPESRMYTKFTTNDGFTDGQTRHNRRTEDSLPYRRSRCGDGRQGISGNEDRSCIRESDRRRYKDPLPCILRHDRPEEQEGRMLCMYRRSEDLNAFQGDGR